MKKEVQEEENKAKTSMDDRNQLDTTFTLACSIFTDEGITLEMSSEAKVF